MLQYSSEEAFLQKWRIKLTHFDDSAERQKLLAIIDSEASARLRFIQFNDLRADILLQPDEQSWSFFSWLWSLLTCCFSDPEPEVSLKDLLSEVVSTTKFKLLSVENPGVQSSSGGKVSLTDSNYEIQVFYNPAAAFRDLQSRIKKLSSDNINCVLERLNVIKYHLEPHCYQNILSELYKKFPLETLSAQYDEFCKDPDKIPGPHEFVENELISRELMSLFISHLDKEPINPYCHAIQELELILLLSHSKTPPLQNPLQTMLKKAIAAKTDPSECYKQFAPLFREAKEQIIALLPEAEIEADKAERETDKERQTSALDKQIHLMRTALNYPSDIFQINPLQQHLAKLACQELLISYRELPEQQKVRQLHSTIKFLSDDILNTWKTAQVTRSATWNLKFTANECEAYLNYSEVDEQYKNATFFANRIVFALLIDEPSLEKVIKEFPSSFLANQKKLAPHELTWILSVVEMFRPNEPKTLKKIEKLLMDLRNSPDEKLVMVFKRQPSDPHLSTNRSGFHHPRKIAKDSQHPAPNNLVIH